MTNQEFITLVRDMRKVQITYFSDRSKTNLAVACKYEVLVDRELHRLEIGRVNTAYEQQLNIFAIAMDTIFANSE